ncbi:MAG: DUF4395 domain-containing protein [Leptospiraceae bacterium]|nr:DUF4395 domain-containing protein [Leptospiraceae bacterium]
MISNAFRSLRPSYPDIVNEHVTRLVAAQVTIVATLLLISAQPVFLAYLMYEFLARLLYGPRFSLMVLIAQRFIIAPAGILMKPTAGPPKRFAQSIGLVFTLSAALIWITTGSFATPFWLMFVLISFAFLEAAFGLCAACLMFNLMIRIGVIPERVCVQCSNLSISRRSA